MTKHKTGEIIKLQKLTVNVEIGMSVLRVNNRRCF